MTAPTPLPPLATSDQWLATQPPNTVPPANIDEMLAAASAAIRRFCGWHVAPVLTQDLVLDGSGSPSQRLPSLRVVDVVSVSNGGSDIDVTGLEWSADGFMRTSGGSSWWGSYGCGWTRQLRGVLATISHGFEFADVGEVTALCCTLATRSLSAPQGYLTSESVGGTTVSYGVDERPGSMSLLGYEQELLNAYRIAGRRAA